MKVTEKDLETVASLSRLKIREEEKSTSLKDLNAIVTYVEKLQQIDTSSVEPTTYARPMQNVFRDDIVKPSLDRDLALSNAPEQDDGYFRVPRVLEE
ncbi:MAG: Asp-tRNA(Asn)/Glu-tRNA(Gln) amidotransferase subunit GatC [Selenomonadaceae bacterium]|nr:Asp-tRNA(Asn)/Glu-tRNA(Gln) amidotransferase subunit GatC [Selenomonadaceae bacterium]